MYSKTVMDHFKNPGNVGTLANPNGAGEIGDPLWGDTMTIYLDVKDDRIEDITFQVFGCGVAIAISRHDDRPRSGRGIMFNPRGFLMTSLPFLPAASG